MPLTHVINKSLKEVVFPSELKLAKVVPIFKAGTTNKITNYRPISVLSFFSKVFEKIIYHKLIDFLDHNDILYCYQFGFRQRHSTQQAIITLVNKITSCLDCGDLVIGIFLDLKKAFDTVDHKILLKKLYAYGIRGVALKLLESYLSGRSQYVVYDYQKSATLSITCGVPQGSVLGPLLFIIYMNDICNVSQLLFTVLYADDTCVLVNGKSLNLIIETVNSELQLLSTWLKSNKLSLNTTKSYYAVFHRARMKLPNNYIKLKIDNTNIKEVQSIKYHGVILDNKLSWIQHISYVKSKISKGIGIMYKARNYVNKNALLGLYHSYIYPYLIYCIESWGTASNCHIDPLYILQKRILRILTFSNYDVPSELLFRYTNILPLCKLVHYRIGIMMYKYANYLLPPVINSLYTANSDIHEHNTRQKHLLHTNKGSTNQFNKCFSNISARVWNALQKAIDVNVSASKFKHISKTYLLEFSLDVFYSK